ncbi:MAG: FoF1 ATP synthase subunit gamma [Thermomicrobiales bacterium]
MTGRRSKTSGRWSTSRLPTSPGAMVDAVYVANTLRQHAQPAPSGPAASPYYPGVRSEESIRDFIFEPSREEVLEALLPHIEVQIYQAMLDALASEHSARMVAMRNATDNANEPLDDLTLTYNKVRQSQITAEVSKPPPRVGARLYWARPDESGRPEHGNRHRNRY